MHLLFVKSLHIYRVPYYQDLRHAQLLLPWATFAALPCKDSHTPVSICFVPHPADWFNPGLIKLRCHIQHSSLLSSQIDTSHILCRPATALPVCIAIIVAEPSSLRRSQICVDTGIRKGTFRPATTVSSNGRVINKYTVDFGHSHQTTHDH